jgi:hypothetical protein
LTFLGCFNLDWKADGICDDQNNHGGCDFDGGDCCGKDVDTDLCTLCQCLEEEAPVTNGNGFNLFTIYLLILSYNFLH